MECSANELTAALYKATVGSGLPVGLAQDAARAAVWLAARGHNGVESLLDALAALKPGDGSAQGQSCLVRGASAVDLALASGADGVTLADLAQPVLIIGFAGIAADARHGSVAIDFGMGDATDRASAIVDASGVTITGSCPQQCDIAIRSVPTSVSDEAPRPSYFGSIEVAEEHWTRVAELAAATYVPATEASRLKGAGAGLTDND